MRNLALLATLILTGCQPEAEPPLPGCDGLARTPEGASYPRLFASTVTGAALVFDTAAREVEARVQDSHRVTQGVAVLPGQDELLYGNHSTGAIQRVRLADGGGEFEVVSSLPLAGVFRRLAGGDGLAAAGVEAERPPWTDRVVLINAGGEGERLIGSWDLPFDPGPDAEGWLASSVAARVGFALSADRCTAWVTHAIRHDVTVLDLDAMVRVDGWTVQPPTPEPARWLGPTAFPSLSPDGAWLAVPEGDGGRVTLVRTDDSSDRRTIPLPAGQAALQAAFSPDSARLWILGREGWAVLGADQRNAKLPTELHVVDLATSTVVRTLRWSHAMARLAIPPDGDRVWVSAAYYTLLGFGLTSLEQESEDVVGSGQQPLLGLDY